MAGGAGLGAAALIRPPTWISCLTCIATEIAITLASFGFNRLNTWPALAMRWAAI